MMPAAINVNRGSSPLATSQAPPCQRCGRTDSTSRVEIDGHAAPAVYSCDHCGYLFASANDPELVPEADPAWLGLRDHVARTKFNRDLLGIIESARVLYDKLDAFSAEHDCSTLSLELIQRGILTTERVNEPTPQAFLRAEDYIPQDVTGLMWAVSMFLSVAETDAIPLPAVDGDTIPFEVTGGAA